MNELLIYSSISLLCLILFYFWYQRQGHVAEKKWLHNKISQTRGDQQQPYVDALNKLPQTKSNFTVTIWMAMMIVPATFAIDYIWFHNIPIEQRISVADLANNSTEAPDLATAIEQLESKLAENPNDLEGQLLYGRSMMSMQKYDYAVGAYSKANQLEPNNASILTELAEAIAFRNNTGSFLGEPEIYLSQAIAIDPQHQKAMWLQGIVYYENLQYQQAETIWSSLLMLVSNPNIRSTIGKQINQARVAQNKTEITIDSDTDASGFDGAVDSSFLVVVDASDEVKAMDFSPTARLFVFAKQVNGPPMPIAAAPISQPFNWPVSIRINDSNNLNPERKISQLEQLEFSAKLSLTGSATPADDDIDSEKLVSSQQNKNIKLTLNK